MNGNGVTSNVDCAMPAGHGLVLTAQQRRVHDELMRLDAQLRPKLIICLAHMYVGAIHALHQRGNPDRFAQAAHSLRELLDRMGDRLGGPIAGGPDLHKEVCDLRGKWPDDGVPSVFGDGTDSPVLDRAVRDFLEAAGAFFARFNSGPPNRREQTGRIFAATDPRQRRLSAPIEQIHTARWLDVRRNLLAIAHHGRGPTESEFQPVFDQLDALLLERLRPRVFEQQDELDRIIAEGEGDS
jgi:hypothetical protein